MVINKFRLRRAYKNVVLFKITICMIWKNTFYHSHWHPCTGDYEHPARNKYVSIFVRHYIIEKKTLKCFYNGLLIWTSGRRRSTGLVGWVILILHLLKSFLVLIFHFHSSVTSKEYLLLKAGWSSGDKQH